MTKSRKQLLLDTLNGKCVPGHELARQLLNELDAYGPFSYSAKSDGWFRYRASNGQFAALAFVQVWTARQTIKGLARVAHMAAAPHGLREAHVATKDDAPIRTTATPGEQRHTDEVRLWRSGEDGQAQNDYTATLT